MGQAGQVGGCAAAQGSLLLILPLGACQRDGRVYMEPQSVNGLRNWLLHFKRITVGLKLYAGDPPENFIPFDAGAFDGRIAVELMPDVAREIPFLRELPAMRRRLSALIDGHDYLHFAIGGFWGDWGALGALMAARRGRKAAVWTDRVESEVMRIDAARHGGVRRIVRWVDSRLARWLERRVISRTPLGLFHGMDTFNFYKAFSPDPHMVHNIHLKPDDRIPDDRLAAKIAGVGQAPLDILYLGRVHPDKGVMDWIETLQRLAAAHIPFRARWFGDGPELEQARAEVASLGLSDSIEFTGAVTDRATVLEALRSAHMMLFCHLTPESPRCLIEALASGAPIIGYASSYSRDLIHGHGGGVLTPMDPATLAAEVIALARDRDRLAGLIADAARDGHDMNDEAVFAHRAALIKGLV